VFPLAPDIEWLVGARVIDPIGQGSPLLARAPDHDRGDHRPDGITGTTKTKDDRMGYLIVFLGAGIGGMLRHGMNIVGLRLFGMGGFPGATVIINITGSLGMGVVAEYFALRGHLPQHWRLLLTSGVLGGYTTFSTFSLDAALLFERGKIAAAASYVLASVIMSIAALFVGLLIVRQVG
jgi:CrcB protein